MAENGQNAIITAPYANILNESIVSRMENPIRIAAESKDFDFYEGNTMAFMREFGVAYIYSNDMNWVPSEEIFYPKVDAIPQCRFGGQVAGTRNLDRIALACYSEFSPELPHCLGEVYVLEKEREAYLISYYKDMIHLPRTNTKLNNQDMMRYGGCLNFDDEGNLYIGTQTQGKNVEGDTEVLDKSYKNVATIQDSKYFENRIRELIIKDGMIAILGRDNKTPVSDQAIEIITRKTGNQWNTSQPITENPVSFF